MSECGDQVYIEQLRKALWSGREYGRAAVMVGAGLSQNARPVAGLRRHLPTWQDLSRAMVRLLYPASAPGHEEAKRRASVPGGILRVAEEFQAAFGRNALDRLLLKTIPDHQYEPGPLHTLLLDLPWSDVFTTNYDTLLERTSTVHRNYDVIRTSSDIPASMRPRIVKLHGSFPSTRPFIITEEDFRTYPQQFSVFVNLAQQAMSENVFCLIGFSGDDPNFLHWAGWVRDNLGTACPQIYLCGVLDLTQPQRVLLRNRNVVPIDLSDIVRPEQDSRHERAIQWLLRSLARGEPPNPLDWPRDNRPSPGPDPEGLPPILASSTPIQPQEKRCPKA